MGAFRRAFKDEGMEYNHFTSAKNLDDPFPWDKINVGVKKNRLNREYTQAFNTLNAC